jgi:nucleolar protein 56
MIDFHANSCIPPLLSIYIKGPIPGTSSGDLMLMHTQWYGTFLLDKIGEGWLVVDFHGAQKDAEEIASELHDIASGRILSREKELKDKGITHVSEDRLKKLFPEAELVELWDFEVPHAHEKGYPMTLILQANTLKAKKKKSEEPRDSNIMSAVGALTDIDSSLNLVHERIKEWYAKYWPEITPFLEDRALMTAISKASLPEDLMKVLRAENEELTQKMEGIVVPEFEEDLDLSGISSLAALEGSLWISRENLESYIEGEMETVAPCLSTVVGPLIGARLIHSAGGLKRMALLPASTVQVLGAEKMFFKFLKEGGKPPKHGVLFQHPWVHSLPVTKRGKMARSMASAASLASRMDAYGGGDPSDLKKKLEQRAKDIREMEVKKRTGGGRQPPFREGWWANKGGPKNVKRRGKRKRK